MGAYIKYLPHIIELVKHGMSTYRGQSAGASNEARVSELEKSAVAVDQQLQTIRSDVDENFRHTREKFEALASTMQELQAATAQAVKLRTMLYVLVGWNVVITILLIVLLARR